MIYAAAYVAELNAKGPRGATDAAWSAVMTFRHAPSGPQGDEDGAVHDLWREMATADGVPGSLARDVLKQMAQDLTEITELRIKVRKLERDIELLKERTKRG